jgi:hypothetical protein
MTIAPAAVLGSPGIDRFSPSYCAPPACSPPTRRCPP